MQSVGSTECLKSWLQWWGVIGNCLVLVVLVVAAKHPCNNGLPLLLHQS